MQEFMGLKNPNFPMLKAKPMIYNEALQYI